MVDPSSLLIDLDLILAILSSVIFNRLRPSIVFRMQLVGEISSVTATFVIDEKSREKNISFSLLLLLSLMVIISCLHLCLFK